MKPEAVKGAFQNILVDERSLTTKVFIIIEISSEKWWKQKFGTEYSIINKITIQKINIYLPIMNDIDIYKAQGNSLFIGVKCISIVIFFISVKLLFSHCYSQTSVLSIKVDVAA